MNRLQFFMSGLVLLAAQAAQAAVETDNYVPPRQEGQSYWLSIIVTLLAEAAVAAIAFKKTGRSETTRS